MYIEQARFVNFGPFQDRTFEFQRGLIGIVGPNGSGKTTIVNGVLAALTNDFGRFAGNKVENICRSATGKKSYIEVVGEHHQTKFKLLRSLQGGRSSLEVNGADLTDKKGGEKVIDEFMRNLLACDKTQLDAHVFVGQASMDAFFRLTLGERAAEFQRLCRLQKATLICKAAGAAVSYPDTGISVELLDQSRLRLAEAQGLKARLTDERDRKSGERMAQTHRSAAQRIMAVFPVRKQLLVDRASIAEAVARAMQDLAPAEAKVRQDEAATEAMEIDRNVLRRQHFEASSAAAAVQARDVALAAKLEAEQQLGRLQKELAALPAEPADLPQLMVVQQERSLWADMQRQVLEQCEFLEQGINEKWRSLSSELQETSVAVGAVSLNDQTRAAWDRAKQAYDSDLAAKQSCPEEPKIGLSAEQAEKYRDQFIQFKHALTDAQSVLDVFGSGEHVTCPTCCQHLDETHRQRYQDRVATLSAEIASLARLLRVDALERDAHAVWEVKAYQLEISCQTAERALKDTLPPVELAAEVREKAARHEGAVREWQEAEVARVNAERDRREAAVRLASSQSSLAAANQAIDQSRRQLANHRQTLMDVIEDRHKVLAVMKVPEVEAQQVEDATKVGELAVACDAAEGRLVTAKGILAAARFRLSELQQASAGATARLDACDVQLKATEDVARVTEGVCVGAQTRLAADEVLRQEVAGLEGQLIQLEAQITENRGIVAEAEAAAARVAQRVHRMDVLAAVRDGFHWGKIPMAVSEAYLAQLDSTINEVLELFGGPFRVFADKDLGFAVHKASGEIHAAERCSGGQLTVLSIALRWAMSQAFGLDFELLVLDEPTCWLDHANIKWFAEVLQRLAATIRGNRQVVVVTHAKSLIPVFDQVIDLSLPTCVEE